LKNAYNPKHRDTDKRGASVLCSQMICEIACRTPIKAAKKFYAF
jgi:hypothetical protein